MTESTSDQLRAALIAGAKVAEDAVNACKADPSTRDPGALVERLAEQHATVTAKFLLPWKNENGWIWSVSLKGGDNHAADVRGWGYLTGRGHGALNLEGDEARAIQDAMGDFIAEVFNSFPQIVAALKAAEARAAAAEERANEHKARAEEWVRRLAAALSKLDSLRATVAEVRPVLEELLGMGELFFPTKLDAPGFKRARDLLSRLPVTAGEPDQNRGVEPSSVGPDAERQSAAGGAQ